jgi:hypothetical protein
MYFDMYILFNDKGAEMPINKKYSAKPEKGWQEAY